MKTNYREETLRIEAQGHLIPATITLPRTEDEVPLILMLHGTGSNRDEVGGGYALTAKILAEDFALASVRIDFQGCGESTADFRNFNFQSCVQDGWEAVTYVTKEYHVDSHRVGVLGWSQGGTDALLAAGRYPTVFRSVVTWAGAPDLRQLFTEEDYEEAKETGFFLRHFDWREDLPFSLGWCNDVLETDVLSVFSRTDAPVLAIAGTEDQVVNSFWAKRIAERSRNNQSELFYIEGMDHTFNVFSESDKASLRLAVEKTGTFFLDTL